MAPKKKAGRPAQSQIADSYEYPTADSPMRPDVGTQAQFKKHKPPKTYRYDTSFDPALSWDEGKGSRGLGEWLLARIEEAAKLPAPHRFPAPVRFTGADGKALATVRGLEDSVQQLKAIERPFLNWAGKAERLSFDVPTLPLFIHERLSTKAILETLNRASLLSLCFQLLCGIEKMPASVASPFTDQNHSLWNCPVCGGSMRVLERLSAAQLLLRSPPQPDRCAA